MQKSKAPQGKYPVRLWLGKYEYWLITMKGEVALRFTDPTLNRFLESFPDKQGLEEYSSVDVADYRALRESAGVSQATLRRELLILRSFWKWLIVDKGLSVVPIKRAFDLHVEQTAVRKRVGITLDCVKRLLNECDATSREDVFSLMLGNFPLPRGKRAKAIELAARRAGLRDFSMQKLRLKIMSRLGRNIIETYLQELRHTFVQKTKSACDSTTDIKVSSEAVWPSVRNSDDFSEAVIGINKQ